MPMTRIPSLESRVGLRDELLRDRYERFAGGWPRSAVSLIDALRTLRRGEMRSGRQNALSEVLAESVSPLWVSTENPYPLHSAAPAPRGRLWNPVIAQDLDTGIWWTLDRATGMFHWLGDAPTDPAPEPGTRLRMVVLLEPNGLPAIYGDFGVVLSLISAGHVLFQWASSAARRGAELRWIRNGRGGLPTGPDTVPLLEATYQTEPRSGADAPAFVGWGNRVEHAPLERRSGPVGALLDELTTPQNRQADVVLTSAPAFTHRRARERVRYESIRTSAQSAEGLSFLGGSLTEEDRGTLLDGLSVALESCPPADLEVLLLSHEADGQAWRVDGLRRDARAVCHSQRGGLGDEEVIRLVVRDGLQLLGCAWIVVIGSTRADPSPSAFATELIVAGMLGQAVGIAAASCGHAAHPLRSLDERSSAETLGRLFPLYLIAGGLPSQSQLKIPVPR